MPASILVVDDERDLRSAICHTLVREGFQPRTADTGAQALALARSEPPPDLVLLDLNLPDMSGIAVCQALRGDPLTRGMPVVMLSARVDEIDRVLGFEVGADDYVTKPFSLRELVLRVRAVLRRRVPPGATVERVTCGRVRVDAGAQRAWLDDRELALTALELRLLLLLVTRQGRVHTREALLAEVWGLSPNVTTRTVDTHVLRLRAKLGPAAGQLQTLRGVGYRFAPDGDASPEPE
ncbi:response regulator transcription factor [Nannocystis sp. SCPEA4]|uniref:response regulator n=1 Tax=Nannocystis sp. SCPEA4 TaxID=2996787 RepID=UPI00227080C7|nr:response regulator transcription factor [Nannocystis sp. SCPEA4]MCY1059144.1 response regulator transcription factor [Nannocystis sp. SCPEA4]